MQLCVILMLVQDKISQHCSARQSSLKNQQKIYVHLGPIDRVGVRLAQEQL